MAKGSGRFRNRKLGFKSRILLQIGVVDFEEDPLDAELEFEDEKASKGVETGVDKEEEHELHLQAVIASSSASVSRPGGSATSVKAARAFIPTPDSAGTIDETTFRELYPKGYVDPVTYIRFSDTVEDATTGAVEYTMDEDDEEWLEAYNASLLPGGKVKAGSSVEDSPRRKSKADKVAKIEDKSTEPGPISEDDFEQVMELFEKTTELKAPMAHVVSAPSTSVSELLADFSPLSQDPSSIPVLSDMEAAFSDILKPFLASLKVYARPIYPHWKDRRLKRSGKNIIPQLDVSFAS